MIGLTGDERRNRKRVCELSKRIRHRGPDWSSLYAKDGVYLSHERMAVVGTDKGTASQALVAGASGNQPMFKYSEDGALDEASNKTMAWICNGEIYNHEWLRAEHGLAAKSKSDSEVVGLLYEKMGADTPPLLDGMYAFVVVDFEKGEVFAARDHMGICPMYYGFGADGSAWFSSEMKCLVDDCVRYYAFPPGHSFRAKLSDLEKSQTMERWYTPSWLMAPPGVVPTAAADAEVLRATLTAAVRKRLMADVPCGVLLSGGLDSSLVTSIACRVWEEKGLPGKVQSFSIGLKDAPDLVNARSVAALLGTEHHEFNFTVQEALDSLPDLIWHLESWHQVRASMPMYMLSRKIKALGVKMVLSGEGADEIFGGYLYFHKAPSPTHLHDELVRKVTRLHEWDVLRANKSTMAWGLEARVPFLDKEFLQVAMNIDPAEKMIDMSHRPDGVHPRGEKYILRKAFDTPDDPYLPESVLWRQKEAFSDGVGYDWVDGLKAHAEAEISDAAFAARHDRWPDDTPETKEFYLLRQLFEHHFPGIHARKTVPLGKSIACSTPEAVSWHKEWASQASDISGRAVMDVHESGGDGLYGEEANSHEVLAKVRASALATRAWRGRGGSGGALLLRGVRPRAAPLVLRLSSSFAGRCAAPRRRAPGHALSMGVASLAFC